jgi:hypothetical protein
MREGEIKMKELTELFTLEYDFPRVEEIEINIENVIKELCRNGY